MKLRISNETHFSTRALRGIITAVARQVAKEEGHALRGLHVRVAYARTWGQAHGAVGLGSMTLFFRKSHDMQFEKDATLPNGGRWIRPKGHPAPSIESVASTVRHELMHNYGYRHTKRGANNSRQAIGWFYDRALPDELIRQLIGKWGASLAINTPKTRMPRDLRAERAAKAAASLKAWERREKFAANKVKAYRKKVRYYTLRAVDKKTLVPTLHLSEAVNS